MGCVQKKKSQNISRPNIMSLQFRHRSYCSKTEYEIAIRPTAGIGFQTLFKQNLIQDFIRNRESKDAISRSCQKKKKKPQSPVMEKMKKFKNTNQRLTSNGVSTSADGSPRSMIIKNISSSDVNL